MHCYRATASDAPLCQPQVIADDRKQAEGIADRIFARALGANPERVVKVADRGVVKEALHGFSERELATCR